MLTRIIQFDSYIHFTIRIVTVQITNILDHPRQQLLNQHTIANLYVDV